MMPKHAPRERTQEPQASREMEASRAVVEALQDSNAIVARCPRTLLQILRPFNDTEKNVGHTTYSYVTNPGELSMSDKRFAEDGEKQEGYALAVLEPLVIRKGCAPGE